MSMNLFTRGLALLVLVNFCCLRNAFSMADEIIFNDGFQTTPWPSPGDVGYRGDVGSLTVIDANSSTPAGTFYSTHGYLEVTGTNVTLDHVFVHGGIDVYGGGTFTLTNAIVEGGWGSDDSFIIRCGRVDGATCAIRDSTVRFKTGVAWTGAGSFAIAAKADVDLQIFHNDICCAGDGIGVGSSAQSRIEGNYVHDLQTSTDNSIHQNAIYNFGATGLTIIGNNRLEASVCQTCSTSSVFSQPDVDGNLLDIYANYMNGGAYTLYLEDGTRAAVRRNEIGKDQLFGPCALTGTVVIDIWDINWLGDSASEQNGTPLLLSDC
jgi:hypothetical protein